MHRKEMVIMQRFIIFYSLLFFTATSLFAQSRLFEIPSALKITLSADKKKCKVNDDITFTVSFQNTSSKDLYFYFFSDTQRPGFGLALSELLLVRNAKDALCNYYAYNGPKQDSFSPMSEKSSYHALKANAAVSFTIPARIAQRSATCFKTTSASASKDCSGLFIDFGLMQLFLGEQGSYGVLVRYPSGDVLKKEFKKGVDSSMTPVFWGYENVTLEPTISNTLSLEITQN